MARFTETNVRNVFEDFVKFCGRGTTRFKEGDWQLDRTENGYVIEEFVCGSNGDPNFATAITHPFGNRLRSAGDMIRTMQFAHYAINICKGE